MFLLLRSQLLNDILMSNWFYILCENIWACLWWLHEWSVTYLILLLLQAVQEMPNYLLKCAWNLWKSASNHWWNWIMAGFTCLISSAMEKGLKFAVKFHNLNRDLIIFCNISKQVSMCWIYSFNAEIGLWD